MMNPKKILCPTDFSKASRVAARKAIATAKENDAEIVFLHVIEETDLPMQHVLKHSSFPNVADEYRKGVERELREFEEELAKGEVRSSVLVRTGPSAVEIADCATEIGADLIIIGTHGYGKVRRFFLGSTTERLMRIAPCSVLLVRESDEEPAK